MSWLNRWSTRRRRQNEDDLTRSIDLAPLAPFREASRELIRWHAGLPDCGLDIVYESTISGARVHVVHAVGDYSSGMENFGELVGTAVKLQDPAAVALFLSWHAGDPYAAGVESVGGELLHVWFVPTSDGHAFTRGQTILMTADGEVENVLVRKQHSIYEHMHYDSRRSLVYWESVLGCQIPRFTATESIAAIESIAAAEFAQFIRDRENAYNVHIAQMKELGVYGDEPIDDSGSELSVADDFTEHQIERLQRIWRDDPVDFTAQIERFGIGGANLDGDAVPMIGLHVPLAEIGVALDPGAFRGLDSPAPITRRIRLWDWNVFTVEEASKWRFIVHAGADGFPDWWFTTDRGVIQIGETPEQEPGDPKPQTIEDLPGLIGLALVEDCRSL